MTWEEAIAVLEESKRQNEIMRDNPSTFWASHQMAEGVKNAKRRIEAFEIALSALRPVRREQVKKVWRGEWEDMREAYKDVPKRRCSRCKNVFIGLDTPFCEVCGAPMTDEAVDIRLKELEALKDDQT